MKRPVPTNTSKRIHVIESDSDDDIEIVVRDYYIDLFVKELNQIL